MSPEELETLLEDALLQDDGESLRELFEHGRVRVTGTGAVVEGGPAAAVLAEHGFVTSGSPVRVSPDIAIGSGPVVTVSRRGVDHYWRLLVVVVPA